MHGDMIGSQIRIGAQEPRQAAREFVAVHIRDDPGSIHGREDLLTEFSRGRAVSIAIPERAKKLQRECGAVSDSFGLSGKRKLVLRD